MLVQDSHSLFNSILVGASLRLVILPTDSIELAIQRACAHVVARHIHAPLGNPSCAWIRQVETPRVCFVAVEPATEGRPTKCIQRVVDDRGTKATAWTWQVGQTAPLSSVDIESVLVRVCERGCESLRMCIEAG